jgi:hypothetical protein
MPTSIAPRFVLAPALALLLAAPHACARSPFEARCEDAAARAEPGFSSRDSGWRVDNSLSYRTLTEMKRPRVTRGYVLGLTRTESHVTVKVDGSMLQDPISASECVVPHIDVTLYYQPIVVYIGHEFAPGSCAYEEILAHEMRHLKSYLDYLPIVEDRVRAKLGGRYRGKPIYAQAGQARELLQREIDVNWLPYIRGEMARIERMQAAIDSPQEYARLSKVCQGEVQSLIGSTRHTRS